MKKLFVVLLLILMIGIGGCNKAQVRETQDIDRERVASAERQNAERLKAAAQLGKSCEQDSNPGLCIAFLAREMGQGMRVPDQTPIPVSPGWKIADRITGGIVSLAGAHYAYKTQQSNNEMWGHIVGGAFDAMGQTTTAFANQPPSYQIGGNAVFGDQDNSTNAGRDMYTAGRDIVNGQIGDTVGRDQNNVGGNQQNAYGNNNFNDGRISSAGPYEGPCSSSPANTGCTVTNPSPEEETP